MKKKKTPTAKRVFPVPPRIEAECRKYKGENHSQAQVARMSRRLVRAHGIVKLRKFLRFLDQNESGPEVAVLFKVSRQRANQIISSLATRETRYDVDSLFRQLVE